ncbi:PspC domain-containing protein [Riemerella columbina]|uniref:PspC domain-containing protein n=1 Tax=Riemerella columbina TaxID=103810 RepID=UPI00035C0A6A|nr:PspC domain-containing protein [Riemerella columbina]
MNKTITIALAGFSFTIEEHAYIKLSDYLAALRNALEADEAEEVMYDIESRMVELFKESLGKREVINDTDVEQMIAQIGRPEQIEEQEDAYTTERPQPNHTFNRNEKQLFRDPERKKIAGVCAGLASYFGMDMTLMRVIWVILFLVLIPLPGSPMLMVLLYAILWLILPKAITAADFLKMRGEPLNFDNLKSESSKIVKFANDSSKRVTELYNDNRPVIREAGSSIGNALRYILGAITGMIGLSLLVSAFVVLGSSVTGGHFKLPGFLGFLLFEAPEKYIVIGLIFITILIPALIFLFLTIKLFSPKTKLKYVSYIIGGLSLLWIILLSVFAYYAISYENLYTGTNEDSENIAINTTSDSLWIGTNKVVIPPNFQAKWNDVYTDDKTIFEKDRPYVDITQKDSLDTPYLIVKREASGYNLPIKMTVPIKIEGNKLLVPNYYNYPYSDRKRNHNVAYELVVPKRMSIFKVKGDPISMDNVNQNNDSDEDDEEDTTQSVTINSNGIKIKSKESSKTKASFNLNGTKIEVNSDSDSIKINGKMYDEDEAEKVLDKMNLIPNDLKDIEDFIISIKKSKGK